MVQHLVHDFFGLQLEWVIGRPIVHLFQQRLLRCVAHKDMEVRRLARTDNVIAELHEFRRQAAGIGIRTDNARPFYLRHTSGSYARRTYTGRRWIGRRGEIP